MSTATSERLFPENNHLENNKTFLTSISTASKEAYYRHEDTNYKFKTSYGSHNKYAVAYVELDGATHSIAQYLLCQILVMPNRVFSPIL